MSSWVAIKKEKKQGTKNYFLIYMRELFISEVNCLEKIVQKGTQ